MNLLEKAIVLAVEAHAGEQDKSGHPYILHPLHLMLQMQTEEEQITAVLHDVIEDTSVTLEQLAAMGFSDAVLKALTLLTHNTASTSYEDYIQGIKDNALARRVKLADLTHNMDIRRLSSRELTVKDYGRLERYHRAWQLLQQVESETRYAG